MKDSTALVLFIGGFIVIIVLVVVGANWLSGISCRNSYENYHPQYSFISGCRVEWKGVLTPVDIVRTLD